MYNHNYWLLHPQSPRSLFSGVRGRTRSRPSPDKHAKLLNTLGHRTSPILPPANERAGKMKTSLRTNRFLGPPQSTICQFIPANIFSTPGICAAFRSTNQRVSLPSHSIASNLLLLGHMFLMTYSSEASFYSTPGPRNIGSHGEKIVFVRVFD